MANGGGAAGGMMAIGALGELYGQIEQGRIARIQAGRERLYRELALWNAEREGDLAVAASQRTALEERRQADLVASRALAVAAASGGGVSDPTVVDILSRTKGEGAYRARVALYEGQARSRAMRMAAAGGGSFDASDSLKAGYNAAALGTAARAGMSLYAKYGMNGPGSLPETGGSGDSALIMDAGTPSFTAAG